MTDSSGSNDSIPPVPPHHQGLTSEPLSGETTGFPQFHTAPIEKGSQGALNDGRLLGRPKKEQSNFAYKAGDIVDNTYQLTAKLGKGGMGVVFACNHLILGKEYALKLLADGELSEESWSRFKIEAKALARLKHPGIVGIHNMGIDQREDGSRNLYYVMDKLSGESLEDLIEDTGRLPVQLALDLFIQIAGALASTHDQGIIHRDIKPSNMMLVRDSDGQIVNLKLVDFGIARLSLSGHATQSQTATGVIFGTPFYMSPEQCEGKRVDQRSDIYSFGCALFEALTGVRPFVGANAVHTFMLHQTQEVPSLASKADLDFPESLNSAVEKMLAKSVNERYQTMEQVRHDLERIRLGKSVFGRGQRKIYSSNSSSNSSSDSDLERDFDSEDDGAANNQLPFPKVAILLGLLLLIAIGSVVALNFSGVLTGRNYGNSKQPHLSRAKSAGGKIVSGSHTDSNTGSPTSAVVSPNVPNVSSANIANDSDGDPFSAVKAADPRYLAIDCLRTYGASPSELQLIEFYDFRAFHKREKQACSLIEHLAANRNWLLTPFCLDAKSAVRKFEFPPDLILGELRIDKSDPIFAFGAIQIPKAKKTVMIFSSIVMEYPQVVGKFGNDDLSGLEIATNNPAVVVKQIRNWSRLEELSFFNSLIKAMPMYEIKYDESQLEDKQLVLLEQLPKLQTLGLCGAGVSGGAIAKMPLLSHLKCLKLKSITDVKVLLSKLPSCNNLRELWLVNQSTVDSDLEPLCKMKNLESLRIRRGLLTPASLSYFKRMKALKHLTLDQNAWSDLDRSKFKHAFADCRFEPVVDLKYWAVFRQEVQPLAKPKKVQKYH